MNSKSDKLSFKEASRREFVSSFSDVPTNEQLILGCLQRIADANERMQQPYLDMLTQLQKYKNETIALRNSNDFLEKQLGKADRKIKKLETLNTIRINYIAELEARLPEAKEELPEVSSTSETNQS